MQDGKKRLNLDLTFLDKSTPRVAHPVHESEYKANWRNILIIGGLILSTVIWVISSNTPPTPRLVPSNASPVAPSKNVPTTPTALTPSGDVQNGQFLCSQFYSTEADKLSPMGENGLINEGNRIRIRQDALDKLQAKIKSSKVTQDSSQVLIDGFNAMIDRYNTQLNSIKADIDTYEVNRSRFNQQVQIHNDYLVAHCNSRG